MKASIQHRDTKGNKMVLQTLIPFMELKDKVVFTNKANPNGEDFSEISESSYRFYQRRVDLTRIRKIEDFIINSILDEKDSILLATLFPSSMILSIDEDENEIKKDNEEVCDVTLRNNIFIVDGQHRMLAMKRVYDGLQTGKYSLTQEERNYVIDYIKRYKFNCTLLVNYDLWEQGQVFVNVNFKQKPVNKSLYYEIFGSEYRETKADWHRNKIYLAHCMTTVLNNHPESPYKGKVKMIGTGKGDISQAFIVEAILPNFKEGGIWEYKQDSNELKNEEFQYFATELLSYFYAIRQLFDAYWKVDDNGKLNIVCKSTVFGAFVRLMSSVRKPNNDPLISALKKSAQLGEVCLPYVEKVTEYLKPVEVKADVLFGKESQFANVSGKGSEVKLYKTMAQMIRNSTTASQQILSKNLIDDMALALQQYMWTASLEQLDSISHHYEVNEIRDFKVLTSKDLGDSYLVHITCETATTLYLDSDDGDGFNMAFPTECQVLFARDTERLRVKSAEIEINVDKFFI